MIKLSLTIFMLISINALSQPFLGVGVAGKGANLQFGILAAPIEFSIAYKLPFTRTDVPTILSISFGKQILLSNKDEDNYTLTPAFGMAQYNVKDFKAYDADATGLTPPLQICEFRTFYSLELGKDSYMGRVFINANYCKGFYFGVGIKMFPYRN